MASQTYLLSHKRTHHDIRGVDYYRHQHDSSVCQGVHKGHDAALPVADVYDSDIGQGLDGRVRLLGSKGHGAHMLLVGVFGRQKGLEGILGH